MYVQFQEFFTNDKKSCHQQMGHLTWQRGEKKSDEWNLEFFPFFWKIYTDSNQQPFLLALALYKSSLVSRPLLRVLMTSKTPRHFHFPPPRNCWTQIFAAGFRCKSQSWAGIYNRCSFRAACRRPHRLQLSWWRNYIWSSAEGGNLHSDKLTLLVLFGGRCQWAARVGS